MDLDDLLRRYFGTSDVGAVTPQVQAAGLECIQVDFGLERDRGKRFALWALMHLLGAAPDLDVAFRERCAQQRDLHRELWRIPRTE